MTIGYETYGSGTDWVIVLHDWMSTHHSYDDVKQYLNDDRFTYVFADHRGYGLSRDIAGEYSASQAAQDIIELADALGCNAFHCIGHSMSGMIGQRLSLDFPQRLKSLILVTPVTAAGMELDEQGAGLFEGAVTDDSLWKTVGCAVTGERLGAKFYDLKLKQHRAEVDPVAFAGFLKMWSKTNFSGEMNNLQTPTLVIAGEHDFPAFSKENYESSIGTWYNDVRIEVLANSGHYPMSETPPYFARVVEDHLSAHI